MLKRVYALIIILLVLAVLSGCASAAPASLGATTPVKSSAPAPTPICTAEVTPPDSSPVAETPAPPPTAQQPAAIRWPAAAASLFSPGAVPDDYESLIYIAADRRTLYYVTQDGNLRRAQWNGFGYGTFPVAENIDASRTNAIIVDAAGQRIFCPGTRRLGGNKSGASIVMIQLFNGARCNVEETVRFAEEDCFVSSEFQYRAGKLLVRLADHAGALVDKWAVFDIAKRSYTVLDLTNFMGTQLPNWRERAALNVALASPDRLLAICTVGDYTAPESTGVEAAEKKRPYECFAVPLDLFGKPTGEAALIAGGEEPACCRLQEGICIRTSDDGQYLIYGSAKASGLYLFDMSKFTETQISGAAASLAFVQWGADGAIYYGLGEGSPEGIVYKTTVYDTFATSPTGQ